MSVPQHPRGCGPPPVCRGASSGAGDGVARRRHTGAAPQPRGPGTCWSGNGGLHSAPWEQGGALRAWLNRGPRRYTGATPLPRGPGTETGSANCRSSGGALASPWQEGSGLHACVSAWAGAVAPALPPTLLPSLLPSRCPFCCPLYCPFCCPLAALSVTRLWRSSFPILCFAILLGQFCSLPFHLPNSQSQPLKLPNSVSCHSTCPLLATHCGIALPSAPVTLPDTPTCPLPLYYTAHSTLCCKAWTQPRPGRSRASGER